MLPGITSCHTGFYNRFTNISILTKVNSVGEYDVELKIHKDIKHPIKINVTGDIPKKKKRKSKKSDDSSEEKETKTVNNSKKDIKKTEKVEEEVSKEKKSEKKPKSKKDSK